MASPYNKFAGCLTAAGLVTQCLLAPWRGRWAGHLVASAVATTVRVVGSVHDYTANRWPEAHVALAAGFTNLNILVLLVANNTYSSGGVGVNHSNFAAG